MWPHDCSCCLVLVSCTFLTCMVFSVHFLHGVIMVSTVHFNGAFG